MSQLPGSPAYGLALSDPPPERASPRPLLWLAALGRLLAAQRAARSAPPMRASTQR